MAVTASDFNPCSVLNALTDFQLRVLKELSRRFAALQRLAELIEKAGDVSGFLNSLISVLPTFVPVQLLSSVEAYNRIRLQCPMLGLPQADLSDVTKLQTELATAYADLLRRLDLHNYNRLDKLQAKIDDYVNDARRALGAGNWMACAQEICNATSNLTFPQFQKLTSEFQKELDASTLTNGVKKPFTVISDAATQKVNDLKTARTQLVALGQSENADIQSIFKRWSATPSTK